MNYQWVEKEKPRSEEITSLMKAINVSDTIATLLIQRGIRTYEEAFHFFCPSLNHLHDPFLMKDMDKAVQRIEKALAQNEKILIYGDYDVDGTTAVSLMYLFLKEIHPKIETYIPDRYTEGYGVSYQGIDFAKENNISLIIALDCGIKAVEKIAYANELGIDFIICDHHRPSETLPKAVAILNPKQINCPYPYKELCGCGVGFKLIQAITQKKGETIQNITKYLDFVAVATAADIVPLTGENRILMHYGLKTINIQPSPGIKALLSRTHTHIEVNDIVFRLAPRINAAGRIQHGKYAVELLTETNTSELKRKVKEIEDFNNSRKNYDATITQEALQQIKNNNEQHLATTVVFNPNWHKGVIGIVASRLIETYYRPTIVFTQSEEKYTASARSVQGFDIYEALEKCTPYIEQFGGHKYAAGLTILPENYPIFKQKFEETVAQTIPQRLQTPKIHIDAKLPLEEISENKNNILKRFQPFGPQNLSPIFLAEKVIDDGQARCIGEEKQHLKMKLKDANGKRIFSAIGFGLGSKLHIVNSKNPFKILYSIEENHWKGETYINLKIRDIEKN